jgi:hypothetical protein
MVGATLSTNKALLFFKEFEAPGVGSVRVALLEAASAIVPLFNASAPVLPYPRSSVFSELPTV